MTVNQNCKNEAQSLFQGPARNSIVEKQTGGKKGKPTIKKKKKLAGGNKKMKIREANDVYIHQKPDP